MPSLLFTECHYIIQANKKDERYIMSEYEPA